MSKRNIHSKFSSVIFNQFLYFLKPCWHIYWTSTSVVSINFIVSIEVRSTNSSEYLLLSIEVPLFTTIFSFGPLLHCLILFSDVLSSNWQTSFSACPNTIGFVHNFHDKEPVKEYLKFMDLFYSSEVIRFVDEIRVLSTTV